MLPQRRIPRAPTPSRVAYPQGSALSVSSMRTRRRGLWAVLGILYLLPSVLGIVLQTAHGAEHVLEWSTELAQTQSRQHAVHSHDGSTHSHGRAVTFLASALIDDAPPEEDESEIVPPVIFRAVLSQGRRVSLPARLVAKSSARSVVVSSPEPVRPPHPPPRG